MVIWRKSSLDKINYELMGQQSFFGRDNLSFKTVNLPRSQRYDNLCNKFRLRILVSNLHLSLPIIILNNI
ncbi:MAG: hypothetical protein MK015_03890 [Alphaproteobacteria bacterium]|jgi:hypothetical protein|nr:hypothetical protein [Alphaproteobacteria bacterium]